MKRSPYILTVLVAVILVAADKKDEKAKEPAPSTAQIQLWVKQLGDDKFKVREEATRNLIKEGVVAFDAVTEARYSEDLEVNQRALRIIKQFKKDAVVYINRGFDWFNKGKFDKAIPDFNEAIRLNPNNSMAYGSRGIAWMKKGELDNAITDYNEAIRLNPNYAKGSLI